MATSELKGMFPGVAHWFTQDAFFTVNSPYRAAPWDNRITGMPDVWRKEMHLRYLNACYVDLDVGRPNDQNPHARIEWREATMIAGRLMDDGVIPQASIMARSGRGVYLFWLLHKKGDPTIPPWAGSRHITLYKQINRALGDRLHAAAPDPIHDASRVLRIPGTLHSKTQKPATYQIQLDDHGRPYTYTLEELAGFMGIKVVSSHLPRHIREVATPGATAATAQDSQYSRPTKNKGSVPKRIKGQIELNAKRAADMVKLEQYHGGWPQGHRYESLRIYANFLHRSGVTDEEAVTAMKVMAKNCTPPYPTDATDTPVADIYKNTKQNPRKYRNETLLRWLRVTPETARELELESIVPDEVKAERDPYKGKGGMRKHVRDVAEAFILQFAAEHNVLPTCRAMAARLENHGINLGLTTVYKIMKKLYPKQISLST